jgi:NADPH:quinone reductase-like Zn-dependent oxidoreductase
MTKMKAIICTKYGPPEVLRLSEVAKPIPNENEVLVKVKATAVTASDTIIRALEVPGGHGFPLKQLIRFAMRLFIGYNRPRSPVLGLVFSGVVETVGENIKTLNKGDEVFGFTGQSRGAYAEYKCVTKKEIDNGEVHLKPKKASHQEAAAIIYGGVLALHFMRNAYLKKGQKVLIYGASGAIGSIAIQLAKQYNTEVTAVCSFKNFTFVASLGADKLLDYTDEDSINQLEQYDFILDAVGKNKTSSLKETCKKSLTQHGKYVSVDDGLLKIQPEYLNQLKTLFESDKLKPVIDKKYPLRDIVIAHHYVDEGHKKGNVVVDINR